MAVGVTVFNEPVLSSAADAVAAQIYFRLKKEQSFRNMLRRAAKDPSWMNRTRWSRFGLTAPEVERALLTERKTISETMKLFEGRLTAEATREFNAGQLKGFPSDKHKKRWVATHDSRTRPSHRKLDGVTLPVHEKFPGLDGGLLYPGDPQAPPSETHNCRCVLIAVEPTRRTRRKPAPAITNLI